ncbi:MAG: ribosome maturation factor RimP [Pyrinomonadaceae bacterium]
MIIVSAKRGDVLGGFAPTFYFGRKKFSMKHLIDGRIREAALRIAEENGLELVHAETVGTSKNLTIRIFIDKKDGVTHNDCSTMSCQLEKIFDEEDLIPSDYLLEVSSPGLERELYSLSDFQKFVGSLAKVKINKVIDGQKNFRGRIAGVEDEEIQFDDKTKGAVRFPYSAVAKANLEIDLEKELKSKK